MESDLFESFKKVRKQIALQSLYPMCYGTSRKIVITGMAADMSLGLKVSQGEIGNFPSLNQLVYIFAPGDDICPVSVEEQ